MILIIVYSVFLFLATIIWLSNKNYNTISGTEFITAIIVVRNEENNIEKLLESLKKQTYSNFEIILVDDSSEDSTVEKINNAKLSNLKLLHLSEEERGETPKKNGVEKAIKEAKGSIIFCTDGDCVLSHKTIETYAEMFSDSKVKFVSGPVTFVQENTIWNQLQTVELSSLVGSAAVAIFMKKPIMSSAANMAYRKDSFEKVNGYENTHNLASGDDELLMNKINNQYKGSVYFAKDKACIIETKASENVRAFYYQRKRWAGKWGASINWVSKVTAVLIFMINATTIYFLATGKWDILLFRFVTEFTFLSCILWFLNRRKSILYIPITQLIYPFYVVFFGLLSLVSSTYVWKGRKLR